MTSLESRLSKLESRRPTTTPKIFVRLSWDDPRLAGEVEPERKPGDKVIRLSWGDERDDDGEGDK